MAKKQSKAAAGRRSKSESEVVSGELVPVNGSQALQDVDREFLTQIASAIVTFFRNVGAFLTVASTLEAQAKQALDTAKLFEMPQSAADDEVIQRFVKKANEDKKGVETHWGICQVVSQVHRRLTARRGVAVGYLEEAAALGNAVHNRYVAAEKARAAAEEERIRRENEERARLERERELDTAEAEAVRLEESASSLSERERLFLDLYLGAGRERGSGQQAAKSAGFRDPLKSSARLLSLPKILQAIKDREKAEEIRKQAEAKRRAPLEVVSTEKVRPNVSRAANVSSRTYHRARVADRAKFIGAVIQGGHGIPWDTLIENESKINEYAGSLQERINLWPGVVYEPETKLV